MLNPVVDVVNPPKAPPVEGRGADGVVVNDPKAPPDGAGVAVGVVAVSAGVGVWAGVTAGLVGGVAGGVDTAGVGFSWELAGVDDAERAGVVAGAVESLPPNADFGCVLSPDLSVEPADDQTGFASLFC